MTPLTRPVRRMAHTESGDYAITLYPGGVIGIRQKNRRKEFTLPIGAVYIAAARAEVDAARREKVKAKPRKKIRRRVRRGTRL